MRSPSPLPACLAVILLAATALVAHAADAMRWPDTQQARHARAFLAAWAADEAAMRALYAEHFDPAALRETPVEGRLERWRALREREGVFQAIEVEDAAPDLLALRVENGRGDERVLEFRYAPTPPHLLLGLGIIANGPAGDGGPPRPSGPALSDSAAWALLSDSLAAAAGRDAFSGVAMLARGDRVLGVRGFGLANRDARRAADPAQRYNMASLGKLWTRTAIAQLAAAGRLSLDDRVARHLRGIAWGDSVTLEQLLEHRGGAGDIFGPGFEARRTRLRANADWMADLRGRALEFPPGSRERYSNAGYVVLGEVVAAVSGLTYERYLEAHVFAPAGIRTAGFPHDTEGDDAIARGYTREAEGERSQRGGGPLRDNRATRPARGSAAGGGYASAGDLFRLDRALVSGTLLPGPWAAWVLGGPRPDRGGAEDPTAAEFAYGGGAPGVATRWVRQGDRLLIVLANRDPGEVGGMLDFAESLLARMRPRP
jgi:CubicO group peptidase (beta-lactamase class C family)